MTDDTPKKEKPDPRDIGEEEEVSFFNKKIRADRLRQKLEGMLKEGVIRNFAKDMKLPREIVTHLISQIDETKQATLKLVSKEIRMFLENTNLSEEMVKLLSQLSFEVSTKVRFVRNDPPYEETTGRKREKRKSKVAESEVTPPTESSEADVETHLEEDNS